MLKCTLKEFNLDFITAPEFVTLSQETVSHYIQKYLQLKSFGLLDGVSSIDFKIEAGVRFICYDGEENDYMDPIDNIIRVEIGMHIVAFKYVGQYHDNGGEVFTDLAYITLKDGSKTEEEIQYFGYENDDKYPLAQLDDELKVKVAITVIGGVVQSVSSNMTAIDVLVQDFDNAKEEYPDRNIDLIMAQQLDAFMGNKGVAVW